VGRWSDVVGRLSTPTLLVTGDPARGALVTPSVAAQVRQLAPQVHTLHLDGTGHSIHRDRPDAFVDGVHAFLHEVVG
jgi:pimeloyl-ACP methyl ester carboxylesterase